METAARSSPRAKRPRSSTSAAQIDALLRPAVGIEAAAGFAVRRAKRPSSTTAAQIDVLPLLPPVGIEAAAGLTSRRAKPTPRRRRRTGQIGIPSRRAKTHLLRPVSNPPNPNWGVRRARTNQSPPPPCHNWKDWANLADGPVGLIAERVLAYDVADYVRFRAVCHPWRQCSTEPRSHSGLDRRFHPRRWILLREPFAPPSRSRFFNTSTSECIQLDLPPRRQRFLNTSTGECIQVDLPELHDHEVLALTSEGLLVLLHDRNHVCLLNPLTRHLTQLPPLTTLLPPAWHVYLLISSNRFSTKFPAWASGILNDDSTVVLCFNSIHMLGVAKPGDVCWTLLKFDGVPGMASSMFSGRFYCVTPDGVKVLEDQPPRLELAAKLPMPISSMTDSVHLVDCAGELMLVHRRFSQRYAWNDVYKRRFDMYRVDLDAGTMCRVRSFGGGRHAMFIGMSCSLSVPIKVFPSGSIRGETIYLSFDVDERKETEGYNLADRRVISSYMLDRQSVAQPYTLVDCLSMSSTGRI